jgi:hypothetical protein
MDTKDNQNDATISSDDNNKKVNFSTLKKEKIYKKIGNIEVYNIREDQYKFLLELITELIEKKDAELTFSDKDILLKLFPELTNITIDYDNDELINDIIKNPSDDLLDTIDAIQEIIEKFVDRTNKTLKQLKIIN